jgi:hypothetical protein
LTGRSKNSWRAKAKVNLTKNAMLCWFFFIVYIIIRYLSDFDVNNKFRNKLVRSIWNAESRSQRHE